MAKKGKGNRIQVILECTTCRATATPGVSRYVSMKNRKNDPERLEIKKYCRYERKHTPHKEVK